MKPRRKPPRRRSTAHGEHRPVLLAEILEIVQPRTGMAIADCTLGFCGHAVPLLEKIGPQGLLVGFDLDREHLANAQERLAATGHPFHLHHGNFAGIPSVLAQLGIPGVDALIADLGMSSMQVDDSNRGFSYRRPGPLDMRMDRSRGKTASELIATMSQAELARVLRELGDEPNAETIAEAIKTSDPHATTVELACIIQKATNSANWRLHPTNKKWNLHPAARTFQALRILVNRELANLAELLRVLPSCLRPGGVAALISFHSGEDRLIKTAFRDGLTHGVYNDIARDPVRPTYQERLANPRSRSAKLRWARRTLETPPSIEAQDPPG